MIAARSGCDAWAAVDQAQRCISSHQCGRTIRGAPRPSRLTGRSRSRTAAGGAADSGTKRDESAALSVAPISFQARRLADRRCRRRCARPSHAACAIRARARIRVMQPRCRSSLGAHSLEGLEVEIRVVRVLARPSPCHGIEGKDLTAAEREEASPTIWRARAIAEDPPAYDDSDLFALVTDFERAYGRWRKTSEPDPPGPTAAGPKA
jgi:hypothetical protein